jgi:hypothetical protein
MIVEKHSSDGETERDGPLSPNFFVQRSDGAHCGCF